MTHGQTPTAVCAPTRAVRLAFMELGDGEHSLDKILAIARRFRSDLTTAEALRVLERRPTKGDPKYQKTPDGAYTRTRVARVTRAGIQRDERGLRSLHADIARQEESS